MIGVDESCSIIKHIVENSFFDEFFEFGISLLGDLMGIFDS